MHDGETLRAYIDNQPKSKISIAKAIGVSKQSLFQYFKSKELEAETKKKFEDFFNATIFKNGNYIDERRAQKLQKGNKQIPFYDANAQGGNELSYTEMTPVSAPSGTIDVGDLLNDSEAAIRIYGNSMIPNYPPGCVIGLNKCNTRSIEPGEIYVIETRYKRVIKRIFFKDDDPDSTKLMCVSDNTMLFKDGPRAGKLAYPEFYIEISDIVNIYCVTGVIKRNTNSVVITR